MNRIENLFKHKFPFKLIRSDSTIMELNVGSLVLMYRSDTVISCNKIAVYSLDGLFNKLKPFLSYLRSTTTEARVGNNPILESIYSIFLSGRKTNGETIVRCIIKFTIEEEDPNINFDNIYFEEFERSYFRYLYRPFKIYLKVDSHYDDLWGENEYNYQPIPPKPLEESFRIDQCVICLENESNILFTDCKHICTCLKCEKIYPSIKCPYCRTEISRKIKIKKKYFSPLFEEKYFIYIL